MTASQKAGGRRRHVEPSCPSPGSTEKCPAAGRWACAVLALSVFGPYVGAGLRTEQIFLYLLASASALFLPRLRLAKSFAFVFLAWFALFLVAFIVGLHPPPSSFAYGNLLAGLDNLAVPLACLLSSAMLGHRGSVLPLRTFAATVCFMLMANSVATVLSLFIDLRPLLEHFWTSNTEVESVAVRAAGNLRYSGIFNQPAESGLAYSFGLLLALWRWWWHDYQPRRFALAIALLIPGGLLSVSKVFVLLGLPVFVLMFVSRQRDQLRNTALVLGSGAMGIGALISGVVPWGGQERLERLLLGGGRSRSESLVSFLSAGRFGEDSTLRAISEVVWLESPIFGFGAQGLQTAYDSAWVESFVIAGLVGVALVFAVLLAIMSRIVRSFAFMPRDEWALGTGFVVVIVGGSLGVPAFTANRAGTIFWIVLGFTLLSPFRGRSSVRMDSGTPFGPSPVPPTSAASQRFSSAGRSSSAAAQRPTELRLELASGVGVRRAGGFLGE